MEKYLDEWFKLHEFHFYMGRYQTKDLASHLGVSTRTIQRWLNKKTKPSPEQLVKIKQYLASQEINKQQSLR